MKVFVYRKCSTCMKALKWLEAHNVEFEERAIKEENPTYEELKEWYTMSGLQLKKFFNTSGMLYKQMNLKDKLKEMTEKKLFFLGFRQADLYTYISILFHIYRVCECNEHWSAARLSQGFLYPQKHTLH